MRKNLGRQVIRELKSQKQVGRNFKFRELQKLKKIENTSQLDDFLKETNHPGIVTSEKPSKIVEQLVKDRHGYTFGDIVMDFLISMLIW